MADYYAVCRAFVKGEKILKTWCGCVGKRAGGYAFPNAPMYADPGTRYLSVDPKHPDVLLSYERWAVAVKYVDPTGNPMLLLNADNGPSNSTRKHQSAMRHVAQTYPKALLPFSALSAAGISPRDLKYITIVATTPDRTVETWRPCRCARQSYSNGLCMGWGSEATREADGQRQHRHYQHFVGETLFTFRDRYYVCGFDRNDDPKRRHFFLALLPEGAKPKTVDAALRALRPKGVPPTALRQGEWFLVPAAVRVAKTQILHTKVPVLTDDAARLKEASSWDFDRRRGRHVATRLAVRGKAVLVSGMLRDREHDPLKLGDGKTWYRVVRNTSPASWGAQGQVD